MVVAKSALITRGLLLEYATLAWNVIGSAVAIFTAVRASSVALAGFGLDSLIEIFASVVVIWQLKGTNQTRDQKALRLIGGAFFLLAIYILIQSAWTVVVARHPDPSPLGISWLLATLLAWGKAITGRQLGNEVLSTEARVTLIDAALAGAVLLGLGLNGAFGWWWADLLAGLVIVYYGFKEGWTAWFTTSG